jgi:hypothetical protein
MRNKVRTEILKKLAQGTTNQMTTDEVNKNKSVAGSPPSFVASSAYPTLVQGLGTNNVPWVNRLSNVLNNALYYSSNGQVNLNTMKSNNFNAGITQVPSEDLKKIMSFCKVVYNYLYTDLGQNFKQLLSPEQIADKVKIVNSSPSLTNLPTVVSSGQLATKIGGNLKTIIQNYLLQIK